MTSIRNNSRPRHVAQFVEKLVTPLVHKMGFASAALILDWAKIVGPQLALHTEVVKASFPKGSRTGGTLYLNVTSGLGMELQHYAPQLIEKINAYYGYAAIARLQFRQGFMQKRGG